MVTPRKELYRRRLFLKYLRNRSFSLSGGGSSLPSERGVAAERGSILRLPENNKLRSAAAAAELGRSARRLQVDAMPTKLQPRSVRCLLWVAAASLYFLACMVMDLLPRQGPPDFRYTGSDPAFAVWNLGWPSAQFIYDARTGLHTGPTAVPLVALQVVSLAFGVAVGMFVGWLRHRRAVGCGVQVVV
jgi:hypothetical protein